MGKFEIDMYIISRTGKIRDAWQKRFYLDSKKASNKCAELNARTRSQYRYDVHAIMARTVGHWEVVILPDKHRAANSNQQEGEK